MILVSSKRVTVNQMKPKMLVLQGNRLTYTYGSINLILIGHYPHTLLQEKNRVFKPWSYAFCVNLMLMYEMTKCVGYWKQFRSNSGNGCSTSQGVLGHRWYRGVHHHGVHDQVLRGTRGGGRGGYKVRPLPSSSFPQHKYTSIRDAAATHVQEKSSIIHWHLCKYSFDFQSVDYPIHPIYI